MVGGTTYLMPRSVSYDVSWTSLYHGEEGGLAYRIQTLP